MQQRRLRLGDILDDYCPRERRITNHAVVAMIDDDVKQTRCTTCDAEHEYKQARVPAARRKKDLSPAAPASVDQHDMHEVEAEENPDETSIPDDLPLAASDVEEPQPESPADDDVSAEEQQDDEGPVHRRLIRATLPRPEGQSPERKAPDFTMRQPGGRGREFNGNRAGGSGGQRQGRGRRAARGPQNSFGGPSRFGGPRQNSSQGGQRPNSNRPGPTGGQRGGSRPPGQQRGPGRKRGR